MFGWFREKTPEEKLEKVPRLTTREVALETNSFLGVCDRFVVFADNRSPFAEFGFVLASQSPYRQSVVQFSVLCLLQYCKGLEASNNSRESLLAMVEASFRIGNQTVEDEELKEVLLMPIDSLAELLTRKKEVADTAWKNWVADKN